MTSYKRRLPIVAVAAFTLLAGAAQATHWPVAGGDAGRSGHQPADRAVLPMKFRWRSTDGMATSPVITSGADLVTQRVAYGHYTNNQLGTDLNAEVRITRLFSYSDPKSTDIDDEQPRDGNEPNPSDPDAFGPAGTDVAPIDASPHTGGPTQLYAVHNDDNQQNFDATAGPGDTPVNSPNPAGNDIALAQIDIATGTRLKDTAIGTLNPASGFSTNGFTVESAPVMAIDSTGVRNIYFVARSATEKRLIRLTFTGDATSGTPNDFTVSQSPNIPDLNTKARPAILPLLSKLGSPVQMVAVSTTDGVRTFRAGNITDPGPSISGLGLTSSPSVPVTTTGAPAPRPTFFYVASLSGEQTVVHKLQQEAGQSGEESLMRLEAIASSPELAGTPGPALAVTQEFPNVSGAAPRPGRVVVGTSSNVYSLNSENLGAGDPPSLFEGGTDDGFTQTSPSTSGELGFISTKSGKNQFVFYLTPRGGSLRVPQDENGFIPNEEILNTSASVGQPALSRGRVVFSTNRGAFTYGPPLSITAPSPGAEIEGTTKLIAHVPDSSATQVVFKVDGSSVGTAPVVANVAELNFNTFNRPDGEHVVTAEATDGAFPNETSAQRPFVIDNFDPPTAALTFSPTVPNVGQDVTLNASGSAPTPGEPNDAIKEWAFEIDGDNDYNDIVEGPGGDGIVTHKFATPGSKTVRVRVTDGHGDVAFESVTFRVNAPPNVNLTASPNPATAGQVVTFDATGTSDSDGSIAKYEFDLDGNGTFELDNGTNPKASKALASTTNVGVRVTDNNGGQSTKTVTVTVTAANQAPVASFIVAPNPAIAGQDVGFSAAGSKDPDGTIAKYEWDFDGNGTFETNTGTNPLTAHKFAAPGVYKVGLRVTDNAGATGTTTVDVIITTGRCVTTNRCAPRSFTATVTPKRDRRLPYVFTTRGRLRLPAGVRAADGCVGRVSVQVKKGKSTISTRRVKLNRSCRFTSKVTFRDRKRLGTSKSLKFRVRFLGNKVLLPKRTSIKTVRIG